MSSLTSRWLVFSGSSATRFVAQDWGLHLDLASRDERASPFAHPYLKILLGVPDFSSDSVPVRTITSPTPNSQRFNFDAEKPRYPSGLQQWLCQTTHESSKTGEKGVKMGTDGRVKMGTRQMQNYNRPAFLDQFFGSAEPFPLLFDGCQLAR
jgi:hypothetical protein